MAMNSDSLLWKVCPFDKNHKIKAQNFARHVRKCRSTILRDPRHHLHNKVLDLERCPFNTGHWIPHDEYWNHCATCSDRKEGVIHFPTPRTMDEFNFFVSSFF